MVVVLEPKKTTYSTTLFITLFNFVYVLSTLKNKCYIIAGPNGAGKTTFANEFLPIEAECLNFINADLIAQGLSPFQPNKMDCF